jgi:hypothetical protein
MELDTQVLPPTPFNEEGYFESFDIFHKNEQMLALLGTTWHSIDTLRAPLPGWWRLPQFQKMEEELTISLRQRIEQISGVWGFKDPRTARLLPLWRRVFRNCGFKPIYVLAVRHPAAVASSLARRDGFPRRASELLWLERNYHPCKVVGREIGCVVHYEDWFSAPLAQARRLLEGTGLEWPSTDKELAAVLGSVINPSLAHHQGAEEIQTEAVRCLYDHLRDRCQPPSAEFLEKFDFALGLAEDYVQVASDLLGGPLVADARRPTSTMVTNATAQPERTTEKDVLVGTLVGQQGLLAGPEAGTQKPNGFAGQAGVMKRDAALAAKDEVLEGQQRQLDEHAEATRCQEEVVGERDELIA